MPVLERLHTALRWLRLESGRAQREVARAAGISPAMLSDFERGKRAPTIKSLGKVLDALGAGPAELAEALAVVNRRDAARAPAPRPVEAPPPATSPESERDRLLREAISAGRRSFELLSALFPEPVGHEDEAQDGNPEGSG